MVMELPSLASPDLDLVLDRGFVLGPTPGGNHMLAESMGAELRGALIAECYNSSNNVQVVDQGEMRADLSGARDGFFELASAR
jgi:hypothetical protein